MLRRAREAGDGGLGDVLFVHPSTAERGERAFARMWPAAAAIADPDRELYDAFGLARGSLLQVVGPRVWLGGLRALAAGHAPGRIDGDPMVLGGLFVLRGTEVVWQRVAAHSAEVVAPEELPREQR